MNLIKKLIKDEVNYKELYLKKQIEIYNLKNVLQASNIKNIIFYKLINEKINILVNKKKKLSINKSKSVSPKINYFLEKKTNLTNKFINKNVIFEQIDLNSIKLNLNKFIKYFQILFLYKFEEFIDKINLLKNNLYISLININDIIYIYLNNFIIHQNDYIENDILFNLNIICYEILYDKLININKDYTLKDKNLKDKIIILQNIINLDSLNLLKYNNNLYQLAIMELIKINNYKYPIHKFKILLNVIQIIKSINKNNLMNNDDLFKYIIYIIIMSNTDKLYSNIEFLYNYSNKETLIGYHGYILTIFSSSINFITEIKGNNLIINKLNN